MRKVSVLFVILSLFGFYSCDFNLPESGEENEGLTSLEVVDGLKKALEIGTDSASAELSMLNGYYGNELLRINLPPEVQMVQNNINLLQENPATKILADEIDELLGDLVLSINRSAENAAKSAAPIFVDAITNLTITDGLSILNGELPESSLKSEVGFDSLAATKYLKSQTYDELTKEFGAQMNVSLEKDIVGGVSAYDIWNSVTEKYNQAVDYASYLPSSVLGGASLSPIETDLGEFVTEQALNGLFYKVGEEEKKIRENPFEWGEDIIQKVFGSIFQKL